MTGSQIITTMNRELWTTRLIMSSDEDQPIVEDLFAGFDESMNFIVAVEHTDYSDKDSSCLVYAVVSLEDAFNLAKGYGVPVKELADAIADSVSEYTEIINPYLSDVSDCFKEIIGSFTDKKCRFKVFREYGKDGYICF